MHEGMLAEKGPRRSFIHPRLCQAQDGLSQAWIEPYQDPGSARSGVFCFYSGCTNRGARWGMTRRALIVSARGWTELALRGMVLSSSRADLFIALGRFVPPVKKDSSLRVTFYDSELLISFF